MLRRRGDENGPMIRFDRCHSGGESVSNYLMLRDRRGHGDHND
jgi:hypothetical protein